MSTYLYVIFRHIRCTYQGRNEKYEMLHNNAEKDKKYKIIITALYCRFHIVFFNLY